MARTWLTRAGIGVFLLFALVVAVFAYQSMQAPFDSSNSGSPTAQATPACSPAPCLYEQGYTLWISNVTVSGDLVRMQVKFKNSSSSTHSAPEDLTLIDGSHHTARITTSGSDCNTWARHSFDHGATFGPIDICFQVTNTTPPFTLRWTPDLGFFCCDDSLAISPT